MKNQNEKQRAFVTGRKPGRICAARAFRPGWVGFDRNWSPRARAEFAAAFGKDAERRAEGVDRNDGESK